MSRNRISLKGLKVYAIVVGFLGSLGVLTVVFMPQSSFEPDTSITYADPAVGSPRVDEIVERLDSDEPYVDPLVAPTVAEEVLTDDVREAAAAADTPIHLVVAPLSRADSVNDLDVLLGRIVHAADRNGLFVLINQEKRVSYELRKQGRPTAIHLSDMFGEVDEEILRATFEKIDSKAADAVPHSADGGDGLVAKVWTGVLFGATLSVPIWFLMKLIRWAARRNRSYLEGFS